MTTEASSGVTALAIGGSWGGLEATTRLLATLPSWLPIPVFLVLHQRPDGNGGTRLGSVLKRRTGFETVSPEDKTAVQPRHLYVAPPGYHMLVDREPSVALSVSRPVHFSRPAIDETFFSIGHVFGRGAVGVVLSGANEDGAEGARYIAQRGGSTLAQDPEEAEVAVMPQAAIDTGTVGQVLGAELMGELLGKWVIGARE